MILIINWSRKWRERWENWQVRPFSLRLLSRLLIPSLCVFSSLIASSVDSLFVFDFCCCCFFFCSFFFSLCSFLPLLFLLSVTVYIDYHVWHCISIVLCVYSDHRKVAAIFFLHFFFFFWYSFEAPHINTPLLCV